MNEWTKSSLVITKKDKYITASIKTTETNSITEAVVEPAPLLITKL